MVRLRDGRWQEMAAQSPRGLWRLGWGELGLDETGVVYREIAGPGDAHFPGGMTPGMQVFLAREIGDGIPVLVMTENAHGPAFVHAAIVEPVGVDDATFADLVAANSNHVEEWLRHFDQW